MQLSPHDDIVTTYRRLREVQRGLNTALFRTLSKKGIEDSARALGFWDRGRIVLEDEEHMGILMDFAIYEYRAGGKNAVERYAARSEFVEGSNEHTVLKSMRAAWFSLLEIQDVVPSVGVHVADRIYGQTMLLADTGLAMTASPGPELVLASRLLPFPSFVMTSGAPMLVDGKLATLFVEASRRLQDSTGA